MPAVPDELSNPLAIVPTRGSQAPGPGHQGGASRIQTCVLRVLERGDTRGRSPHPYYLNLLPVLQRTNPVLSLAGVFFLN